MAKLYHLKGLVALALLNLGVCNSPDSIVQEKYAPVSSQYSVQEEKAPESLRLSEGLDYSVDADMGALEYFANKFSLKPTKGFSEKWKEGEVVFGLDYVPLLEIVAPEMDFIKDGRLADYELKDRKLINAAKLKLKRSQNPYIK